MSAKDECPRCGAAKVAVDPRVVSYTMIDHENGTSEVVSPDDPRVAKFECGGTPTESTPACDYAASLRARAEAAERERDALSQPCCGKFEDCTDARCLPLAIHQRDAARAELAGIDAAMARRPALDKPTRRENVEHAIATAAKADERRTALGRMVSLYESEYDHEHFERPDWLRAAIAAGGESHG